jgi:hypothetical protein
MSGLRHKPKQNRSRINSPPISRLNDATRRKTLMPPDAAARAGKGSVLSFFGTPFSA